jgi:hypothetical protein
MSEGFIVSESGQPKVTQSKDRALFGE